MITASHNPNATIQEWDGADYARAARMASRLGELPTTRTTYLAPEPGRADVVIVRARSLSVHLHPSFVNPVTGAPDPFAYVYLWHQS